MTYSTVYLLTFGFLKPVPTLFEGTGTVRNILMYDELIGA